MHFSPRKTLQSRPPPLTHQWKAGVLWTRTLLLLPLVLIACTSGADETPSPTPQPPSLMTLTSNFQVGGEAGIVPPTLVNNGVSVLHADAVARSFGGKVYVVNRLGADNIQLLDPTQNFKTLSQFSVGAGTNPQDIAVVSAERAYVALYNEAYLLVVNPQTGATLGTIDLAPWSLEDPDGLPEASSLMVVDEQLFVTLQRLERASPNYLPTGESTILRIDLRSDTVTGALPLAFDNPFGLMRLEADGTSVLLAEPGVVGNPYDGGVERIDLVQFQSMGTVLSEAEVQADVLRAVQDGDAGLMVLLSERQSDGSDNTRWSRLELPGAGTYGVRSTPAGAIPPPLEEVLLEPSGFVLWDLLQTPEGDWWVTDRTLKAPALWSLSSQSGSAPTAIPFGADLLPPTWMVVIE